LTDTLRNAAEHGSADRQPYRRLWFAKLVIWWGKVMGSDVYPWCQC